jgi:hypothetical protein
MATQTSPGKARQTLTQRLGDSLLVKKARVVEPTHPWGPWWRHPKGRVTRTMPQTGGRATRVIEGGKAVAVRKVDKQLAALKSGSAKAAKAALASLVIAGVGRSRPMAALVRSFRKSPTSREKLKTLLKRYGPSLGAGVGVGAAYTGLAALARKNRKESK